MECVGIGEMNAALSKIHRFALARCTDTEKGKSRTYGCPWLDDSA